jgi:hypothetical protein
VQDTVWIPAANRWHTQPGNEGINLNWSRLGKNVNGNVTLEAIGLNAGIPHVVN